MQLFDLILPRRFSAPILISIPHAGTFFPKTLRDQYLLSILEHPSGTDWFVDRLYSWAQELGFGLIKANYSRLVIDLNRSDRNEALYHDGRHLTDLVAANGMRGEVLYRGNPPTNEDTAERIASYYIPYHDEIERQLSKLRTDFGHALLWEAHSIKRHVPEISAKPFSDLILGTVQNSSARLDLIKTAVNFLKESPFQVAIDEPFMGGFLTRKFGRPAEGFSALQLEMSQDLYLDEENDQFLPEKAQDLSLYLSALLLAMKQHLMS